MKEKIAHLSISIIFVFSIISSVYAYECSEESIKEYVLTEFASTHEIDNESVEVITSKSYQLYGKDLFSADVKVLEDGKVITFYALCETGKVYSNQQPSFEELTGIEKISRELYDQMQQTNGEIKIIVYTISFESLNQQIIRNELQNKGMAIFRMDEIERGNRYMFLGQATSSEIYRIADSEFINMVDYNAPADIAGQVTSDSFFLTVGIVVIAILIIVVTLWIKKRK